jgi:uncharacterized protein (DUF488 family)
MALTFKNLLGEPYYVKEKATKTGKTTYFLTKKLDEACLNKLPIEYEVFEKYDTRLLYIRKAQPTQFSKEEIKVIEKELKKNKAITDFKLDCHGNEIKIYVAEDNESSELSALMRLLGGGIMNFKNYEERMKIKIDGVNENKSYEFMRYCFRGSVDDWIPIGRGANLQKLAQMILIHLGEDSYYELHYYQFSDE